MMTLKQALKEIIEREHPITVRGAFYRAVSAGLFPGTDQEYYKTCAKLIKRIREDGALPYEWIIDSSRTREESLVILVSIPSLIPYAIVIGETTGMSSLYTWRSVLRKML